MAGEEIAGIPCVQIGCNSELDAPGVAVSEHVRETIDPDANRWEQCSRVLSRKDATEKLSESW